ncbi:hypothetical protein PENTCL1PPCAC_11743, partial [Pristionchus entomophagus]
LQIRVGRVRMDDADEERTPALAEEARAHSMSPRRGPVFDRVSQRWWNPQFRCPTLEAQYWQCSFPQLRDRFRSGLIYISIVCLTWCIFLTLYGRAGAIHWVSTGVLVVTCGAMLFFTLMSAQYQRFYMPTSFLCTFLICVLTLVVLSDVTNPLMSPVGTFVTSIQVVLLIYTVIPLPLYLCIFISAVYSTLFELLSISRDMYIHLPYVRLALHIGVHMLGVHLFILTQVRQRKTFLKIAQSLMARKDLELETQFKDHMIQSVMPKKVADELLKDANELRRPSTSLDSTCRTSNATQTLNPDDPPDRLPPSVPNVRKFRPFTMNLMTDVSILFADICGFTKMSSNKSADELVNLLNDLFGRFDNLCRLCEMEKISTLGDCYYCVAGCPEPSPDHAKRCVEMGLQMVIAIRQFDIDRGQDVNMRVGIHTGKVMCGMVGTRRFKFDVFSNDVNLANEMESTGIAGRVHISEATVGFLDGAYLLEDGQIHKGMKTYFIKSRANETNANQNNEDSGNESDRDVQLQRSGQISFRKVSLGQKIAGKLKTIQSNSLPMKAQLNSSGSLRMKVADRAKSSHSTTLLPKEPNWVSLIEDRKSASLQALTSYPNAAPLNKDGRTSANGSSANSCKGSRSSGLQDGISDLASVGGIDTAISLHHNAGSMYETDNKEFDERLAQIISNSDRSQFDRGFWVKQESLNPWTLNFNEKEVEDEYRRHFAESRDGFSQHGGTSNGNAAMRNHHKVSPTPSSKHSGLRYSGVFIDLLVASLLFVLVSVVAILGVTFRLSTTIPLVIFVFISMCIVLFALLLIGLPLLSRRNLMPCLNLWLPRHVTGLVLLFLPVGVALFIAPFCLTAKCPFSLPSVRLLFSYVSIIALFGHCNFSQLVAWPKTLQCVLTGVLHVLLLAACQFHIDEITPPTAVCNATLPGMQLPLLAPGSDTMQQSGRAAALTSKYLHPMYNNASFSAFLAEIVLDVVLSVLLVGFLNYQFEAAFRLSFYGDVQSRRDTERMQIVRDQADWLLNNVIPPHAVESLKTDTKYSENHHNTAVLFASITNWNDMYEENFEGGREFLRVLNEVIGDFDELLERPEFNQIEKIKTIGACYMAASGLNPEKRRACPDPKEHIYQLIEFALALQHALSVFNEDLLNFDFVCKLGLNIGPVTAGVIGTTKLYYDIWGDTVNIASRMYSTGVCNKIQVSQHTRDILSDRYDFEYRDHIEVKGIDAGMDTYILLGRKADLIPPAISESNDENKNSTNF